MAEYLEWTKAESWILKAREERKEEGNVKGIITVIKEIIKPSRFGKVLFVY